MADLHLELNDGVVGNSKIGVDGEGPARNLYVVIAENGLNKNGQHYPQGSQVPLTEETARNFAAAGDIQMKEESTSEQPSIS